jgi:hypothetical protein
MGRRAKNKQAPPESIDPKPEWKSKKQLGKRKAEADDGSHGKPSPRPTKKVKDLNGKGKGKAPSIHNPTKSLGKNKKPAVVEEEDDGSEGWEDVEDSSPAKASKYVFHHHLSQLKINILLSPIDHYLKIAMKMTTTTTMNTRIWTLSKAALTTLRWTKTSTPPTVSHESITKTIHYIVMNLCEDLL